MGVWWFRLHVVIMFVGTSVLHSIGFAIVYTAAGPTSSSTPIIRLAHGVIGIIIMALTAVQVVYGVVIDRLYNPSRKSIPIWDKGHWWLGRLLYAVAIVNVPVGMATYSLYVAQMSAVLYALFGVVVGLSLAYFGHLEWKLMKNPSLGGHGNNNNDLPNNKNALSPTSDVQSSNPKKRMSPTSSAGKLNAPLRTSKTNLEEF